ncbi:unnamed protein product [Cylicocyclus nassatus]|uniref:Ectonucleotide pyrophosphatase/phosphodiesterase family member 3 n=1 Tax=Cylicocyclus nassatus TaxID=53992 RepID=A0AA36M409_CYLNA|nr:unnamed protein product [Cylicocyclus nassatus]
MFLERWIAAMTKIVSSFTRSDTSFDSKSGSKRRQKKTIIIVAVIVGAVVLVALVLIAIIVYLSTMQARDVVIIKESSQNTTAAIEETTTDSKCKCVCTKKGFAKPHPPLLVISFDGFAKNYLSRKLLPTFEKIAECGVRAETVYPGFPAQTFPNHWTMATGLHPGHSGLVGNTIYDPEVLPKPSRLSQNLDLNEGFYTAIPIWDYYMKETKQKVATYSWIGSQHLSSHYEQPDIMLPFNKSMKPPDQFYQVLNWLKMGKDRPNFIMLYIMEPDATGHGTMGAKLNNTLIEVDDVLRKFIEELKKEGLYCCINIVIVSDHGMTEIKHSVVIEDYMNVTGMFAIPGIIAHIFKHESTLSIEDMEKGFTCKKEDHVRVFKRSTLPLRLRFTYPNRIGDLVLISEENTGVVVSKKDVRKHNSHGHDYVNPDMHTVMFATGPSLKNHFVLPPFEMVEYMNLWMKLLGLPARSNDGEPDFMDLALNKPVGRGYKIDSPAIEKCTDTYMGSTKLENICGTCSQDDQEAFRSWSACDGPGVSAVIKPHSETEKDLLCVLEGCKDMAIFTGSRDEVYDVALFEIYQKNNNEKLLGSKCTYRLLKDKEGCGRRSFDANENVHYKTLSAVAGRVLANEHRLIIPWKAKFIKDILTPLNEYTNEMVTKFGRVVAITGCTYNDNNDGIRSKKISRSRYPTHLYRILLTCDGEWADDGDYCANAEATKVLSFVFPHMDGDPNCLARRDLLLQYTATVKDIEKLLGIQFNFVKLSNTQQMLLKMHVTIELW